jgi:hypothetical protein
MNILKTLDRCMHMIPLELIENRILYIEVDKENYEEIDSEILAIVNDPSVVILKDQKVADIGKCITLTYNGYNIIIVQDKNKNRMNSFYLAFKTTII